MKKNQQTDKNKSAGGGGLRRKSNRESFRVDAHIHLVSGLVPHEERANIRSRLLPQNTVRSSAAGTLKKVDISGVGIAFDSDDYYQLGDIVALKIVLETNEVPLLVYGEVLRVEPFLRCCRVAMKFVAIDEKIRSIITGFVFKREREILAERRVGWL